LERKAEHDIVLRTRAGICEALHHGLEKQHRQNVEERVELDALLGPSKEEPRLEKTAS
jgi:hypothetical protein